MRESKYNRGWQRWRDWQWWNRDVKETRKRNRVRDRHGSAIYLSCTVSYSSAVRTGGRDVRMSSVNLSNTWHPCYVAPLWSVVNYSWRGTAESPVTGAWWIDGWFDIFKLFLRSRCVRPLPTPWKCSAKIECEILCNIFLKNSTVWCSASGIHTCTANYLFSKDCVISDA